MVNQIIAHTPTWVFALFFALIYLGVQQTQVRTVTIKRMIVLPIAMLGLSLSGVWAAFNHSDTSLICWAVGLTIGALTSFTLVSAQGVSYSHETRTLQVPGSWLPLCVMIAIFVTKYIVGFSIARTPALIDSAGFVTVASLFYGLWSGVFAGRTLKIAGPHGKHFVSQTFNI